LERKGKHERRDHGSRLPDNVTAISAHLPPFGFCDRETAERAT
jgi:hypothetical protein